MGQGMDGRGLGRKWGQWEEIVVLVLIEMKTKRNDPNKCHVIQGLKANHGHRSKQVSQQLSR